MDLSQLTVVDLQYLLGVKFCFLAFVVVGLVCVYKKVKPFWFLLATGFFSALSYFIFTNDVALMFWGLQGDEVTIAAMYNTFAHYSFFSDFAYLDLPPFYPPLFFWIFALPGKFFQWNGVQMAKVASGISLFIFPLLSYGIQKWYEKVTPQSPEEKICFPSTIAFVLLPLLTFLFIDWDAFILKPYEVMSGVFCILWTVYLGLDTYYQRLTWKRILSYGITGGLLFMTYYLWLIFGALALAIFALTVKKQNQWYYYSRLFVTALIVFAVASPYIIPLVLSYHKFGSQNFQLGYFNILNARLQVVMFEFFSWRGIMMLGGFISLLFFRHRNYMRLLISFFISIYIWYVIGLFTLFFAQASNQEFKGFYIIDRILLAFALAYGIERLWSYFEKKNFIYDWKRSVLLLGLFYLSTQMIFGFFMNDPVVLNRRYASNQLSGNIKSLSQFLNEHPVDPHSLVVQAGIPEIYAFTPINSLLYFSIHNSNPAANFSKRQSYLESLQYIKTAEEFARVSEESPYGKVRRFIFFQEKDNEKYSLHYSVDNFPHGGKSQVTYIPKKLFVDPYFKKVYENARYIVFDVASTP